MAKKMVWADVLPQVADRPVEECPRYAVIAIMSAAFASPPLYWIALALAYVRKAADALDPEGVEKIGRKRLRTYIDPRTVEESLWTAVSDLSEVALAFGPKDRARALRWAEANLKEAYRMRAKESA